MQARAARHRWRWHHLFDAAIGIGFSVASFANRRGGLPEDGLWFDDSWVAAGALKGSISNLMTVGSGHPSLTALLMGWSRITGDDLRALAYPMLVIGALGPALLYLALRRFGYATWISAALGAALLASDAHILYSGRVKGYVIDPILILGILLVLPRLARLTWRWPIALGWAISALVLGGFSGYLLVTTAAAGILLLLHANRDRLMRLAGVGLQGVLQLAMLTWAQHSTNLAEIEATQEKYFDGHLTFHLNPLRMAQEIHQHVRRVAEIYPGGSGRWLSVLFIVAVLGLVIAAFSRKRQSEALRAQLGLLVLSLALIGGILGRFPFGTSNENPLSLGGRHSMWLTPVLALGLAALAQRLVERAAGHQVARQAANVALAGVTVLVLSRGGFEPPLDYPFPGSELASEYIEAELRPGDVVLVTQTGIYAFAIATDLPATMEPTPDRMIGFTPVYEDRRIRTMGAFGEVPLAAAEVEPLVAGADRVFVHVAIAGFGRAGDLDAALVQAGFEVVSARFFAAATVSVWERNGTVA